MSLDGLRVNHAGLELAAQDLAHAVQQIDERLGQLEAELSPLRSDWTGHAQQAYVVAKATWDKAMEKMRILLQDTSVAVLRSNAEYQAADARGAAAFGG